MEESGSAVLRALGYELEEMPDWTCCGTVFGLNDDDLYHQLAPVRNLARVESMGGRELVTICAMCYNTLSRANLLVRGDREKLEAINHFMDEEPDYRGGVAVTHLLRFLMDEVGVEELAARVTRPLRGLRVSPYYGCLLLRPGQISVDNMESPTILSDLIEALGGEPVDTPNMTRCCGSYHTVEKKEAVARRAEEVISSARKRGADMLVLSCPLCEFNLDSRQKLLDIEEMPVLYFTELLALAFGLEGSCQFDDHYVDPRPLLRDKGLLG